MNTRSSHVTCNGKIEILTQATYQHRSGHLEVKITGSGEPTDYCLLLETSGSSGGKQNIQLYREIISQISQQLSNIDRMSLLTFGSTCTTVVPGVPVADFKLPPEVGQSECYRGPSNLGTALRDAFDLVTPDRATHLIIITQGYPSEGIVTQPGLISYLQSLTTQYPQTTVSTVGLKLKSNPRLLSSIAKIGGGQCHHFGSSDDITKVISTWLGTVNVLPYQDLLLSVIPADTTITNQTSIQVKSLVPNQTQTYHVLFTPITGYDYQTGEIVATLQLDYAQPETFDWNQLVQPISF